MGRMVNRMERMANQMERNKGQKGMKKWKSNGIRDRQTENG